MSLALYPSRVRSSDLLGGRRTRLFRNTSHLPLQPRRLRRTLRRTSEFNPIVRANHVLKPFVEKKRTLLLTDGACKDLVAAIRDLKRKVHTTHLIMAEDAQAGA